MHPVTLVKTAGANLTILLQVSPTYLSDIGTSGLYSASRVLDVDN